MNPIRVLMCWAVGMLIAGAASAQADAARVIVSFKPGAAALREHPMSLQQGSVSVRQLAQLRVDRLALRAGRSLQAGRSFGARAQVVFARGISSQALVQQLRGHPELEYAVVDQRRRFARLPFDPLFASGPASGRGGPAVGQWYLRAASAAVPSAINAQAAWDRVTGNPSVVVAVLDTGVLFDHPDLAGVLLAGYDMVHDSDVGNDGSGRDANAADPGDWITADEDSDASGPFFECGASNSSWHGTEVSGIIGAVADNGQGIAGTAYGVRILPVRVLGKCGGYDSDIIAGMYWAAGIDQFGIPANRSPARVLNMSLGGDGACSTAYLQAVQEVTARGAVIVAAAGNSTGHAVGTPANCPGVIGVAGLRHAGSKVGFSDLGPQITISAPGGNCINIAPGTPCLYPISTTSNSGTRSPLAGGSVWTDSYAISVGTSFSAPLVSGTVALMLAARPQLMPAQIIEALRRSARPFPITGADNGPDDPTPVAMCRAPDGTDQLQCYCNTALCGAGMLDAAAAVQVVLTPSAPEEIARQLMNFGERSFAQYFPDRPATQVSAPFVYRYYPSTGIYLGVVVQPGLGYVMDGVYVLGGPFGGSPALVGRVTDFIVPVQ